IRVGEGAFQDRFCITCTDAEHARRILTPTIQRLLLEADAQGASWWSIGNGWVSCVSRHEPINRTHGQVMSVASLDATIHLPTRVAAEVCQVMAGILCGANSRKSGCQNAS